MRITILLLVAAIVASCGAMGQATAKRDSSMHYDIHLSATAIFSGGNLKRTVVQNRLSGSLSKGHLQLVTETSYRFGKNFTRVVENDFLTRNYLRFLFHKRLYGFLLGVYEDNYRRSIQSRWQWGVGGAFNCYVRKKDFLRFSLAGVYEKAAYKVSSFNLAEFNGSNQVDETRIIARLGGQHTVLDGHLVLKHDTWLMQGLRKANNYRWHSLLGLQIPLYKGLAFKTDYEYTFENLTISSNNPFGYPSSRADWILSFGLSYDINKDK